MKLNKILFAAALASVIGGSMTSCSESFLDEDLKTQYVRRRRCLDEFGCNRYFGRLGVFVYEAYYYPAL